MSDTPDPTSTTDSNMPTAEPPVELTTEPTTEPTAESSTEPTATPEPAASPARQHGRLYYFFQNLRKRFGAFIGRHKLLFSVLSLILLGGLFYFRHLLHPLVLQLRINLFVIVFALLLFLPLWLLTRKRSKLARVIGALTGLAGIVALWFGGPAAHQYLSLYYRYNTLDIVELDELPTTDHERIPPLNSIHTIAKHKIADTESPMRPDFVRVGDSYRFTLAIEPAYEIRRRFEGIR